MKMLDANIAKLFVKCWKEEHKASLKHQKIVDQLRSAEACNKPTERLRQREGHWYVKINEALDPLIPLIKAGTLTIDTPEMLKEQLGTLLPYVEDCYAPFFGDNSPEA